MQGYMADLQENMTDFQANIKGWIAARPRAEVPVVQNIQTQQPQQHGRVAIYHVRIRNTLSDRFNESPNYEQALEMYDECSGIVFPEGFIVNMCERQIGWNIILKNLRKRN